MRIIHCVTLIGVTFLSLFSEAKVNFKRSIVVSSDDTHPKINNDQREVASTKEPNPPKIYQMRVDTNVTNRYAKTLITSKVTNLDSKAQEATFSVVTPDKAFISEFVIEIDGKKYKAYVQEKEQAKRTYNEAKSKGYSAGHVAVSARDSNRFTVSVNLEPQSKVTFYLTYEELLVRKDEKYEVVLNIHPGQPIKDLAVQVNILESRPLKFVKVPSLRSGNEVSKNDVKADPEADIKTINQTSAVVTFNPDIAKQKILTVSLGEKEAEGLSGQFVVQYDVERDPHGGEVLVEGGYFVHFFAPEDLTPLKKEIVFVLDTSGSMSKNSKIIESKNRIGQVKEAMDSILAELKPEDIFSIVEFNSGVKVWNISAEIVTYTKEKFPHRHFWGSKSGEPELKDQVLPASFPATAENIVKAIKIIKMFYARGGTDIQSALETSLGIIETNKDSKSHQPIIVFLTDGEPTVGEINAKAICNKITELNNRKVPIFSLSFGDGADRDFLKKLSLKNQGFARHIYDSADSHLQLKDFYKQISSPLLSNVTFKYTDMVSNVTKRHFPLLFHGGELYLTGRLDDPEFNPPQVEAWSVKGPIELKPEVYHASGSLERLWAYLTVRQLLDQREIADDKAGPTQEALKIALKYSFVTDVSSLVVVKPNATFTVNTEDASKSAPNPTVSFMSQQNLALVTPARKYRGKKFRLSSKQGKRRIAPMPVSSTVSQSARSTISPVSSTYANTYIPSSTTALSMNPLKSIPWLVNMINANGTIILDSIAYSLGVGETVSVQPECHNSVNNSTGNCTLLDKCPTIHAHLTDLNKYKIHFCQLKNVYAGVCCPIKMSPRVSPL